MSHFWMVAAAHRVILFCLLVGFAVSPSVHAERHDVETPLGKIYVVISQVGNEGGGSSPSANGDTYSFQNNLGADGLPDCSSVHMQGMDDNTVLFDGLSEFLDPYTDGTQPLIFEFETTSLLGDSTDVFLNSFSDQGGDLFPEGFEDPETGTPLTDACLEIGIDDTMDFDQPVDVTSATAEASSATGSVIPITDITSLFPNPWNGRASILFENAVGQGIDGLTIELTVQQATFDPQPIFSDGFESGDASAWTDSVP